MVSDQASFAAFVAAARRLDDAVKAHFSAVRGVADFRMRRLAVERFERQRRRLAAELDAAWLVLYEEGRR